MLAKQEIIMLGRKTLTDLRGALVKIDRLYTSGLVIIS
jgi:hypothetical protein